MAQVIINLDPTTETEAVNAMLSSIGESPVADASTSTQADVQMGLNLLRTTARELQSEPWRFNFEAGVELAPTNTLSWTDTAAKTTLLNIFKVPRYVASWRMTKCLPNGDLDLVERLSKQYQETGVNVVVLYDRAYNRDGAEAARFPHVYIDAISRFNFEQMPETARRLVTVMAARRFCHQILGSQEAGNFALQDEAIARRFFQQDQGEQEDYNMLNSNAAYQMLGQRPRTDGGTWMIVRPGHS